MRNVVDVITHADGSPLGPGGQIPFLDRFDIIARSRPELLAISAGDEDVTYGVLNARADRLAQALRKVGVTREVVVGICLPRGIDAIVAVLAILKAGGAYLALEPAHPLDRRRFMLKDAGATALVTVASVKSGLEDLGLAIVEPN